MLRHYPAYRLEDFYSKKFVDGGVTYAQLLFLYNEADDASYNKQKFLAALRGIDLDAENPGRKEKDRDRKSVV